MFGFIDDIAEVVEDAIDVTIGIGTAGIYGDLSKDKVSKLVATGLTIYQISEMTGWATDLIEEAID